MFTKIHLIGVEFSRDTRNLTAFELAAAAHAPFAVSLEARAIGRPFSGSTGTWTVHHHENYKRLLAFPLMVEHLLRAVEADSFDDADFSTLEKLSAEYVSDALLKRHGDTVWRLRLRDRWTFLLVLLECQSRGRSLDGVAHFSPTRACGTRNWCATRRRRSWPDGCRRRSR